MKRLSLKQNTSAGSTQSQYNRLPLEMLIITEFLILSDDT